MNKLFLNIYIIKKSYKKRKKNKSTQSKWNTNSLEIEFIEIIPFIIYISTSKKSDLEIPHHASSNRKKELK